MNFELIYFSANLYYLNDTKTRQPHFILKINTLPRLCHVQFAKSPLIPPAPFRPSPTNHVLTVKKVFYSKYFLITYHKIRKKL